jgi:hypothetical protein
VSDWMSLTASDIRPNQKADCVEHREANQMHALYILWYTCMRLGVELTKLIVTQDFVPVTMYRYCTCMANRILSQDMINRSAS